MINPAYMCESMCDTGRLMVYTSIRPHCTCANVDRRRHQWSIDTCRGGVECQSGQNRQEVYQFVIRAPTHIHCSLKVDQIVSDELLVEGGGDEAGSVPAMGQEQTAPRGNIPEMGRVNVTRGRDRRSMLLSHDQLEI